MDVYKLNGKWPQQLKECERMPAIQKIGYTWFANAQMQVFNHTPAFLNHFRNYSCEKEECLRKKHKSEMKQDGGMKKSTNVEEECYHCMIKEYIEQVEECQRNNNRIASGKFLEAVMRHPEQMGVGRYSSAEVFFMRIRDKLKISNKKIILDDLYNCKVATIRCCKSCGNEFWRYVTSEYLILNKGSVTDKLAEMCKEKDELHYTFSCEKCEDQSVIKKRVIDSPPHILRIRLTTKISELSLHSRSDFSEAINIRPYMEVQTGPAVVYELYAVVVYTGGHYYADCKAPSGQWNNCDDGFVRQMSLNEVLKENPFCLYYKRSPYKGVYDKLGIEEALIREQLYYDNLREKIARDADAADKKIKEFEEEYDAHAHEYSYESYSDYSTNPSSTDDDSTEEDQT